MSSGSDKLFAPALVVAIFICVPTAAATAGNVSASHPLLQLTDGLQNRVFVGEIGVQGQAERNEEVLKFEHGRFTSNVCRKYGFPPAPYWIRRDDDGLHFLATLENPDNGIIRFEGTFDGTTMHATARWTKHRWYWTVDQTLVFKGRPDESPD